MSKSVGYVAGAMLALALVLPGCQAQQTQTPKQAGTEAEDAAEQTDAKTPGGWTVDDEAPAIVLTDDERDVFERAVTDSTGVGYEPVRVLATQVVAGTNYAFLCLGDTVTAEPSTSWYVVTVYEDLEGNASITTIEEIYLADVGATPDSSGFDLLGGWTLPAPDNGTVLPEDAQTAFGDAYEDDGDVALSPLVLLGTQVVSGTNYRILCDGANADGERGLYIADVYEDVDGEASLTDVEQFDLLDYV